MAKNLKRSRIGERRRADSTRDLESIPVLIFDYSGYGFLYKNEQCLNARTQKKMSEIKNPRIITKMVSTVSKNVEKGFMKEVNPNIETIGDG